MSYQKSVLLLADSQARNVENIVCGRSISISGGCFGDLVDAAEQFRINTAEYTIIIVCCGVNDAQRSIGEQWDSFGRMLNFLNKHLQRSPKSQVIVSLPVPHRDVIGIPPLSTFVQHHLSSTLPNVNCINWAVENDNPFTIDNFQTSALYDYDRFHHNHAGFRVLLNKWCDSIESLKSISFNLTPKRLCFVRNQYDRFVPKQ